MKTIFKKVAIIQLIMCILMSLCFFTPVIADDHDLTSNTDEIDVDIEISCIEDLVDLSIESSKGNRYEGKNIVLLKNLDFNEDSCYDKPSRTDYKDLNQDGSVQTLKEELTSGQGFTPIQYFSGNFYGQGNEIRNIYINSDLDKVGIFQYTHNALIRDLSVTGTIKTSNEAGKAGGIAGFIYNNTSIINCCNFAELEGYYVGGIVGFAGPNNSCEIKYCHNASNCLIDSKDSGTVGGIVGTYMGKKITISNCYNTGNFEIKVINTKEKPRTSIGGILGSAYAGDDKTDILECYNIGNISVVVNEQSARSRWNYWIL